MPYTEPGPESTMRFIRPFGMALLALFLALPLALVAGVLVGPFDRDTMQYVIVGLAAVLFLPLMRLSRYRRARAAERERSGEAGPPGGANLAVAGILAVLFGVVGLWMVIRRPAEDGRVIEAVVVFLTAGAAAIGVGLRRIRARRAWRAGR